MTEVLTPAEGQPFYRGPYILARAKDGELRFLPAKKDEAIGAWVALTPEEVEEQTR